MALRLAILANLRSAAHTRPRLFGLRKVYGACAAGLRRVAPCSLTQHQSTVRLIKGCILVARSFGGRCPPYIRR